jgi:hypothetical protein
LLNVIFKIKVILRLLFHLPNYPKILLFLITIALGNGDWLQIETEIPESILTDSSSYEIIFEGNSLILTNIGKLLLRLKILTIF